MGKGNSWKGGNIYVKANNNFSRGWIYPSSANLLKLQGELITPPPLYLDLD